MIDGTAKIAQGGAGGAQTLFPYSALYARARIRGVVNSASAPPAPPWATTRRNDTEKVKPTTKKPRFGGPKTWSRRQLALDAETLTNEEQQIIADEIAAMPSMPADTDGCPLQDLMAGRVPFCPWAGCRYHLYLDVMPNGSIKFNFPDFEIWELHETCALHAARFGGMTLANVGSVMNICRERVRQLIEIITCRLRCTPAFRELNPQDRSCDHAKNKAEGRFEAEGRQNQKSCLDVHHSAAVA